MSIEGQINSQKPQRACPVCQNAARAEVLHTQRFVLPDNHLLPVKYDLVACYECGFVYADTPAGQDTYDAYYADTSKYDRDYINRDTRLYTDTVAWLNTFIRDKTAAIIEIGCGNGQLLNELQRAGFLDLTALDPSESCIDAVRARGIKGMTGSIFGSSCGRQYDCVILQGVLEHICDIPRAMNMIRSFTKPGGMILVAVPDASRYRDYDAVPYDYFNIEHINHFEETSLINLGFVYGLSTVSILKAVLTLHHVDQPVIFCIYKNAGKEKTNWQGHARQAVMDYVVVTQANHGSERIIDELYRTGEQIAVWGAGNFSSRLLAESKLDRCNILMFVDNDKHKQRMNIQGKAVNPPEVLSTVKGPFTIVVAVAVFPDEILAQIKSMGLNNRVLVLG